MEIELGIADFLSALLLERGASANTVVSYQGDLKAFAGFLLRAGLRDADAVTLDDIDRFVAASNDDGCKPTTCARRTAAIRSFFHFLRERRVIAADPTRLMDPRRVSRPLPRVLSEREVAEMLDAVSGDSPRDLRDRAMLETLYGCGLRVSELCALRTDDIVADGELVRVTGKGSKTRLVPVGSAVGRTVGEYLDRARGSFLRGGTAPQMFLTRFGRAFTRQGVFKVIRERAAAVGIAAERISPHVMRHCYATHMLAHGADIRAIQELLGHSDIGTTQIYTHVDVERFSAIHRRFHPRA